MGGRVGRPRGMTTEEQQPTLAMIRQRQSLFRLAFEDRRVTRAMLYRQAEEFERWLSTLASEEPPRDR
jgi:hypothetical protein